MILSQRPSLRAVPCSRDMTKPGSLAMQSIERAMVAKSDSNKEVSFHAAHYITNAFSQLVSRMKFALAFPDKAI
jgi:hypothetical protein